MSVFGYYVLGFGYWDFTFMGEVSAIYSIFTHT